MPGAFAHLTAANFACGGTNSIAEIDMPQVAKLFLSRHINFVELGCVSPDYPYLAIGDKSQNKWADLMHYDHTGDLIKVFASECKALTGRAQEKVFAWLCGYISHVLADITIHPVVEFKVGPYIGNEQAHRVCEMHQDTYIWQRMKLGEIGLADRIKSNMGSCVDEDGTLDKAVTCVWGHGLSKIHSAYAAISAPDFDKWHGGFQTVVNNAEEGYRLFKWARHVSADLGLSYPRPAEINEAEYILNLDTPQGLMNYDDIFDLAVSNIQNYIGFLGRYVFDDGSLEPFRNWNLDDGRDEFGELTAWEI